MGHVYAVRSGSLEGRSSLENPSTDFLKALVDWVGPGSLKTASGREVTPDTALRGTIAVYACVRVIAEDIGQMPFLLYQDRGDQRERIPPTKGLSRVLHQQANPAVTASAFWESMGGIAALWGNSYAYVVRDHAGDVAELWLLQPGLVDPVLTVGGRIINHSNPNELRGQRPRRAYIVTVPNTGEKVILNDTECLHVAALATDGLVGLSPIAVARQIIAANQLADEFQASFYANSAMPGGIIGVNRPLKDDDVKRYRAEWEKLHRGLSNAHRVAIMDAGVSWTNVGMPLEDAQFVETRLQDALAIARVFRVQPHLLGILDRATWANIEHQGIDHQVHTIGPWANRIEGAVNRDLGRPPATLRDIGQIPEFLAESLLRMDTKSRWEAYQIAQRSGALNRNEIRARENLPPVPGGDTYLTSADMVAIAEDGRPVAPGVAGDDPA